MKLTKETDPRCAEYYAKAFPNLTKEEKDELRLNWIKNNVNKCVVRNLSTNLIKQLTESELAFINQMKAKGYLGCSMTINGNQTWISFYS